MSISKRRVIKDTLKRLGLQCSARQVVEELARIGIDVSERVVQAVRLALLQDAAGLRRQRAAQPQQRRPALRHQVQKRPRRRR